MTTPLPLSLTIDPVPGVGNRRIIDTRYDVRRGAMTLASFSNSRDASTFAQGWQSGYNAALQDTQRRRGQVNV